MQQILMSMKRSKLLEKDKRLKGRVEKDLKCKVEIKEGNQVFITGEPYDEFNARNVLQAFGRGFEIDTAYKLLSDDYFFYSINLKELFHSEDQLKRIKSRIIGENGKAKLYIESVSGAKLCIYGNTVSVIGKIEEVKIADSAIQILLDGGTHNKAYMIMEKIKRNMK